MRLLSSFEKFYYCFIIYYLELLIFKKLSSLWGFYCISEYDSFFSNLHISANICKNSADLHISANICKNSADLHRFAKIENHGTSSTFFPPKQLAHYTVFWISGWFYAEAYPALTPVYLSHSVYWQFKRASVTIEFQFTFLRHC